MTNNLQSIQNQNLQDKIHTISGLQVMLDSDLAELYQVETRVLNQAVNRNSSKESLRSQIVTLENSRGKHRKYLPYVFTEQGVSMLSAVLRSDIAIKVSIQIIEAFVSMRKFISNNGQIFQRLDSLEQKQFRTDEKIDVILNALEEKTKQPSEGIFYDGQIYDAYAFVNDLLKRAKIEVVLIDNYIDDTVFTLFSKYSNLKIKIYTADL